MTTTLGQLSGTDEVVLVAGIGTVTQIIIHNADTSSVVLTIRVHDGLTSARIWSNTLRSGETLVWDDAIELDRQSMYVSASLGAAVAANEPDYFATKG